MDETIIYRYLAGAATEEEKQQLLNWLKASPANKSVFFDIKAIWSAKHSISQSKASSEQLEESLSAINQRIDRFIPLNGKPADRRRLLWIRRIAVAAVLVAAFVSIPFLYNSPEITPVAEIVYINDAQDSVKKVFLPDGTLVWLNASSRLTYPAEFTDSRRLVELQGEAFFEVAKDTLNPFIVKTNTMMVKAIGTSFCVTTSPDGICKTTLQTGAVQLLRTDGNKLVALTPGQQAVYSSSSERIEIRNVDVEEYIAWRFDLITLAGASASSIIHRIEETYGIQVKMDTAALKNKRYNFSFRKNKGASDALRRLSYMTGIPADTIR